MYKSYRGFDAVLRAYNGWGCNIDKISAKCNGNINCIRGTVFYVDKVHQIAGAIEAGNIQALPRVEQITYADESEGDV